MYRLDSKDLHVAGCVLQANPHNGAHVSVGRRFNLFSRSCYNCLHFQPATVYLDCGIPQLGTREIGQEVSLFRYFQTINKDRLAGVGSTYSEARYGMWF